MEGKLMNVINKKGFSLIELMVVVAIIGILATIAVPNFQKFQARSKQTNAKAELSSLYSAQKSFFAEYSTYSTFLPSIGYVPEGMNLATVGYSVMSGFKRYYGVSSGITNTTDWGNLTGTLLLASPVGSFIGGYQASANLCSHFQAPTSITGAAAASMPSVVVATDVFTANSAGCPLDRTQIQPDVWWINNNRVVTNAASGL
jgi:type IV pilus assembly protein PilA